MRKNLSPNWKACRSRLPSVQLPPPDILFGVRIVYMKHQPLLQMLFVYSVFGSISSQKLKSEKTPQFPSVKFLSCFNSYFLKINNNRVIFILPDNDNQSEVKSVSDTISDQSVSYLQVHILFVVTEETIRLNRLQSLVYWREIKK